jgi:hypothetical protein
VKIVLDETLPVSLRRARCAGKPVARQVDETTARGDFKKIDELRAPWSLADARELESASDAIDGRRLARIRTPAESDLEALIGWEIAEMRCALEKNWGKHRSTSQAASLLEAGGFSVQSGALCVEECWN